MGSFSKSTGHFWGIPHGTTAISLDSADIRAVVGAAAGLGRALALTAKGVAFVGGGIALGAAAVATFAALSRGWGKYNWHQLAEAGTSSRKFTGVCLNSEFKLLVEGHKLHIPVEFIKNYRRTNVQVGKTKFLGNPIFKPGVEIKLFDGSNYQGQLLDLEKFIFLTSVGVQEIDLSQNHRVEGISLSKTNHLKQNLESYLDKSALTAERLIGEEAFNRFFVKN